MREALPIHELFHSFQGEGCHAGRAAFFIRTYGCPVHCPWCDSAGTWHPEHRPNSIRRTEVSSLVRQAVRSNAGFVVITGGEPTIHNLHAITRALHSEGLKVHLETSGAFPIQGEFDWITLSPKRWKLPLPENIDRADELKIIVDRPEAVEEYSSHCPASVSTPIWLHPEWSQRTNPEVLNAITDWIKTHGDPFRAGWQLHKPYAADALDPRSLPARTP